MAKGGPSGGEGRRVAAEPLDGGEGAGVHSTSRRPQVAAYARVSLLCGFITPRFIWPAIRRYRVRTLC